jgi:hypothetical protein
VVVLSRGIGRRGQSATGSRRRRRRDFLTKAAGGAAAAMLTASGRARPTGCRRSPSCSSTTSAATWSSTTTATSSRAMSSGASCGYRTSMRYATARRWTAMTPRKRATSCATRTRTSPVRSTARTSAIADASSYVPVWKGAWKDRPTRKRRTISARTRSHAGLRALGSSPRRLRGLHTREVAGSKPAAAMRNSGFASGASDPRHNGSLSQRRGRPGS